MHLCDKNDFKNLFNMYEYWNTSFGNGIRQLIFYFTCIYTFEMFKILFKANYDDLSEL